MKYYSRPQMMLNLDCNKIAASHLHALSVVGLKVAGIRLRRKNKTLQDLQQDERRNHCPKESSERQLLTPVSEPERNGPTRNNAARGPRLDARENNRRML
jgi:hypothetical protein